MSPQIVARGDSASFARPHDAFWAGLYIVDDGYGGVRNAEDGGELLIEDPRLPLPLAEAPHLRLRLGAGAAAPLASEEVVIRPASGNILLFPSWLRVGQRPQKRAPRTILRIALVASRIAR